MRIIKSIDDVYVMSQAKAISPEFSKHLIKFFDDLQADLDDPEPDVYSIEECGHVIILESGDNVRDLSTIGLNRGDLGLLGCIPEWFEIVILDDIEYYRFLVLYNDAFGVIFYSAVGSHDVEVEQWLEQNLDNN